ncbi:MAG: glycosyltransferase family 2 protein [Breznakibacter sp.]|nr:glycosyltransferase family 2 protein [Breznakibacter sp.]
MSIKLPSISVCLCTFNGSRFIREQLDSIIKQTHLPNEVIICDDCSTDGTELILKEYQHKYPFFKIVLNQQQLGFNKNFEKAILLASSDYIAISDQDDIWRDDKLAVLLKSFVQDSNVVYSDSVRFTDKIDIRKKTSLSYRRVQGDNVKNLFLYNTVSGHAIMFKRSFIDKILPFPSEGYYDWWIAMVSTCNGGLSYVDEVLVYQRIHGDNQSVRNRPKDERSLEYKKQLLAQLKSVSLITNVKERDAILAKYLISSIHEAIQENRSWKLFVIVMINAKALFFKKRRLFPIITWLKSAYQFALCESL